MAIKVVKNSTKAPKKENRTTAARKPAYYRAKKQTADSGAWIKWVILAVLGVVTVVAVSVGVANDKQKRVTRPNTGSYASGSKRSALDGFDMKKWCKENEKNNEELQARRARLKGQSGR